MKQSLFFAAAWLCLLLAATAALAETKEFKDFSVSVPQEWEAQENGGRVMLVSPGKTCVVAILVGDATGMDSRLIAGEMAQILKGSAPEPVPGSEAFAFEAEIGGVPSHTRVQAHEGKYLLFSVAGDREAHLVDVAAIWASLDSSDPAVRELIRR